MKNLQGLANDSLKKYHNKKIQVGKAQALVLDRLGVNCVCFGQANTFFENLGITVLAVRSGRRSIPKIIVNDTEGGGLNIHNEGEAWNNASPYLTNVIDKISEFIY